MLSGQNGVKFVNIENNGSAEVDGTAPKPFKPQLTGTFAALMTAAPGMIAAPARNGAVKALTAEFSEADKTAAPPFVRAAAVTTAAAICILFTAMAPGN